MCLSFALGEILKALMDVSIQGFFLLPLIMGVLIYYRFKRNTGYALAFILVMICFLLGNSRYSKVQNDISQYELIPDGKEVSYSGTVDKIIEKEKSVYLYIDNMLITVRKELYNGEAVVNDYVLICGNIRHFDSARNKGNFDENAYYHSLGITGKIEAASFEIISRNNSVVYRYARRMKERFLYATDKIWNRDYLGMINAMTVGDRELIDDEAKEDYQIAGISHILVVSGIHLSIIGLSVYKLLRKRFRYLVSTAVSSSVMIIFAVITGGSVSVKRALIMYFVGLLARITGRSYDLLSSLALAFLILAYSNPFIIYNTGFLLSVCAIVGIALGSIVWDKGVVVLIVIQIFTLPMIMYSYYEISTYSIISNFAILPLVSVLLLSGYISGFVFLITGCMWLAKVASIPGYIVLKFYDLFISIIKKLPYNQVVTGKPELRYVILFYLVLIIFILAIANVKKAAFKIIFALIISVITVVFVRAAPDRGLYISVIDVGQGDCILIHSDDYVYMIDCGSSSEKEVYRYYVSSCLKAHGIEKIDMLFLTHMDTDHINGVSEMMREGMVECLVMPDICKMDDSYNELVDLAWHEHINVKTISAGMVINDGSIKLSCVNPVKNDMCEDVNELSVVLRMDCGNFSALFTGDLGSETEKRLLKYLDKVDFLKVGHHGSKYSTSDELLDVIRPEYAVISVGKKNFYGHPNRETIERLEAAGSKILRTDELGEIMIKISPSGKAEVESD